MSDQKSQEVRSFNSVGELLEEARKRAASIPAPQETKGKGLEFMALRLDVARKHLELAISKKITPAEDNLLKIIQMGTVGAQNSRSQICTRAEFFISDLSEKLGYKTQMKIWKLLKSLEEKKYLTREKTRSKGREILGLNPKEFGGQILADQQHEKEQRRYLRLVPSSQTDCMPDANESFDDYKRSVCDEQTDRLCSDLQVPEVTQENLSLDSSRFILDSSRGQNGEGESNDSFFQETKKRTPAEHIRIIREQLAEMKAGKL